MFWKRHFSGLNQSGEKVLPLSTINLKMKMGLRLENHQVSGQTFNCSTVGLEMKGGRRSSKGTLALEA